MPKGNPGKQTVATDKWQKKAGYITKGIKMKRELADAFKAACDKNGQSQSSVICEFMREYIEKH